MARKYQHTMELLPQIKEMLAKGMSQKEIENALDLTGSRPIHHLSSFEAITELQKIYLEPEPEESKRKRSATAILALAETAGQAV